MAFTINIISEINLVFVISGFDCNFFSVVNKLHKQNVLMLRSTNLARQVFRVMDLLLPWLSEQSEQNQKYGQQQVGFLCKFKKNILLMTH